jgi:hypothetical protein
MSLRFLREQSSPRAGARRIGIRRMQLRRVLMLQAYPV